LSSVAALRTTRGSWRWSPRSHETNTRNRALARPCLRTASDLDLGIFGSSARRSVKTARAHASLRYLTFPRTRPFSLARAATCVRASPRGGSWRLCAGPRRRTSASSCRGACSPTTTASTWSRSRRR
jgi:hypothetical protein